MIAAQVSRCLGSNLAKNSTASRSIGHRHPPIETLLVEKLKSLPDGACEPRTRSDHGLEARSTTISGPSPLDHSLCPSLDTFDAESIPPPVGAGSIFSQFRVYGGDDNAARDA